MTRNGSTRAWRKQRDRILAASTTCHICGHDQADSVDHLTPVARDGTDHDTNLAPAHLRPCPTCGQRCNLRKGTREHAPVIRRSGSLAPPAPHAPAPQGE